MISNIDGTNQNRFVVKDALLHPNENTAATKKYVDENFWFYNTRTITSNYVLQQTDNIVFVDSSGGDVEVSEPNDKVKNLFFVITKVSNDSNKVSILGEDIYNEFDVLYVACDGSSYHFI